MYQSILQHIPPLQNMSMKFTVANGDSIRACGVEHLPIQMRFSHSTHVCILPVFTCNLSPNIDRTFSFDVEEKYVSPCTLV